MYLGLVRHSKGRPGTCPHVTLEAALPGELRVSAKVVGGLKIHAAGMAGGGREAHFSDHVGVGSLVLHRSGHAERRLPGAAAARL